MVSTQAMISKLVALVPNISTRWKRYIPPWVMKSGNTFSYFLFEYSTINLLWIVKTQLPTRRRPAYFSNEGEPQQEANNSNDQDQNLSAARPPQMTWEQVSDGRGQALHAHKLQEPSRWLDGIQTAIAMVMMRCTFPVIPDCRGPGTGSWGRRAPSRRTSQEATTTLWERLWRRGQDLYGICGYNNYSSSSLNNFTASHRKPQSFNGVLTKAWCWNYINLSGTCASDCVSGNPTNHQIITSPPLCLTGVSAEIPD